MLRNKKRLIALKTNRRLSKSKLKTKTRKMLIRIENRLRSKLSALSSLKRKLRANKTKRARTPPKSKWISKSQLIPSPMRKKRRKKSHSM